MAKSYNISTYRVYKLALSKLFEDVEEDPDFKAKFPLFLDTAMMESLDTENQIRRAYNANLKEGEIPLEILDSVPLLDSVDNETIIEMDDKITRVALPYAIASHYFADEGNNGRALEYRNRFILALQDACPVVFASIKSIWDGDD